MQPGMTNTDPASFEVLAEQFRREAKACLEIAERIDGPRRKKLVLAAAQWLELAQEAEAHRRPN
jgi:hypothetical protein